MKYLTIVCCVLITIAVVQAEDTCTTHEGKTVNVGEKFHKEGECSIYTCDSKDSFSALTCAETQVINPEAFDYHEQDNSKPWPDCCPKYVKKE